MEELPGNYIDIDQPTYVLASFNVKVVDNKLVHIDPVITVKKLQPGLVGTACDPRDVCVVVEADKTNIKWTLANNEIS
jgi:hypothetical protein